ncbi:hypothetical protein BRADI_3g16140v3 [Brachypodium distachyon]|uniref:Glabrous enhancer-binding protein-like DBD domain-containing protein n=1 Tax=Brachypodium distachyon TaxID=15368 RepID=A0A2K2CXI3_BRADI|nr:hypothetical protein BRADI_3g16140v3 [Brachypodium distachyon]
MKHKRSRKTASGSKGSVDSGSSLVAVEPQIDNKPPPPEQDIEGSRSDQDRAPTDGAVAGEEEEDGYISSSDLEPPPSASSPVVSQEDDDEDESPDNGHEGDMQPQRMKRSRSNDAPGPNPQPNKKKRDTASDQPEVPALDQEAEDEGPHGPKEIRPASPHQPGERGVWFGKVEKVRRVWYNKDEVLILNEIHNFLLERKRLPELKENDFFESILEQLEDDSCDIRNVKDKMKSLKRRYDAHVVSTTNHERLLDNLSEKIWGPRSSNNAVAGYKNEDKISLVEAEKKFEEMYPLLAQEVKLIADEDPSAKSLCIGLDAETALSIEKRLGKIKGAELKLQKRMEAKVISPKAMVRKKLARLGEKVAKKVRSLTIPFHNKMEIPVDLTDSRLAQLQSARARTQDRRNYGSKNGSASDDSTRASVSFLFSTPVSSLPFGRPQLPGKTKVFAV